MIQLLEEKKSKKSDYIITENYHTRLRENAVRLLIKKINLNFYFDTANGF
jgi:CRISPR-associated protein Cas1